jgi:hypothetical protein
MGIPQGILTNNCSPSTLIGAGETYYGGFGGDVYKSNVPTNALTIPISTTIRAIGLVVGTEWVSETDEISLTITNLSEGIDRTVSFTQWRTNSLIVSAITPLTLEQYYKIYMSVSFVGDFSDLQLIQTFALYDLMTP